MAFSLTENLPFLALPLALMMLKITYDLLPLPAFLALVAAAIAAYMYYAGNKSPAAQRTAKRAEVTAESLIQEVTEAENRAKEAAAKKQAAKDKKAANKQKQEAIRKAQQAVKEAAAAEVIATQKRKEQELLQQQQQESKSRVSSSKSKKQSKKQTKVAKPAEDEDSEDDADEVLQRMAALERQRRSMPQKK